MWETGIAIGTVIMAVIGLFYALYRHVGNTDCHPVKKDIVFRDVCRPKMDSMNDRIDTLDDCVEKDLANLKELMIQRFENLENLVRNNGRKPPRVST